MFGKQEFSKLFKVGEIIESGAGASRKNAARLKILAIEDEGVRYQSLRSASKARLRYAYLKLLPDNYERLDPTSIQKSVNAALKRSGFMADYSTENYAYSFAKAFTERKEPSIFLSQGESPAFESSDQEDPHYTEGRRVAVMVERIERDQNARLRCIRHYGTSCKICHFDFEKIYGAIGKGFIHVHHHRQQLAKTRGAHKVDPVRDLIPLCPNCHAMVHKSSAMLSVNALRAIVEKAAASAKSKGARATN